MERKLEKIAKRIEILTERKSKIEAAEERLEKELLGMLKKFEEEKAIVDKKEAIFKKFLKL